MRLRKVFGRNVRYYRFENHMTQERLAELTDLSPRYISNIENGSGNVSLDTIELLAEALKVDYMELFNTVYRELKVQKVNMRREEVEQ